MEMKMAALLLGPYYPAKINNDKFMKTKQCMGGEGHRIPFVCTAVLCTEVDYDFN